LQDGRGLARPNGVATHSAVITATGPTGIQGLTTSSTVLPPAWIGNSVAEWQRPASSRLAPILPLEWSTCDHPTPSVHTRHNCPRRPPHKNASLPLRCVAHHPPCRCRSVHARGSSKPRSGRQLILAERKKHRKGQRLGCKPIAQPPHPRDPANRAGRHAAATAERRPLKTSTR